MPGEGGQETRALSQALDRALALLDRSPALAERQAHEILEAAPGEPRARLVLGMALRRRGELGGARACLEALAAEQPRSAQTWFELGQTLRSLDDPRAAVRALGRCVHLRKNHAAAWRTLAELAGELGDPEAADRAYAEMIRASVTDPRLMGAAAALCEDRLDEAERLLREHLRAHPSDVAAMRMLAEAGTRLGRYAEVEALLDRCLELAPGFEAARFNQAWVLFRQQKGAAAIGHLRQLLAAEPASPRYRSLLASCLALIGDDDGAIALFGQLIEERPQNPTAWLNLGHALRKRGERAQAEDAYERAIALAPALGDAWWSLADLGTRAFAAEEERELAERIADPELSADDRLHLCFALGKAMEDRGAYPEAFGCYAEGARLRRKAVPWDRAAAHAEMLRAKALFTEAFFAERAGVGCPDPSPIFIVGLPRPGSALIEHVLASHSQVEGGMELPDIVAMCRELGWAGGKGAGSPYPEVLAELSAQDFATLGEAYLDRTRAYRRLGRPMFIDKTPANFHHLGLIRLVLPRAKVIDARRHPMAAGFSAFRQPFARGHAFSYDLADVGAYYRDYLDLMGHFDAVLPGWVVRVIHEDLVDDPEGQIRRLLDRLGLPFEAQTLRIWETDRAVRTASSEQAPHPIFRDGLEPWRNFAPWLDPLEEALGPALGAWRGA